MKYLFFLLVLFALAGCGVETDSSGTPTNVIVVEDPTEDPVEDPTEDPIEDPIEDPTEDPVEDPTEDPVEDPIEDPDTEKVSVFDSTGASYDENACNPSYATASLLKDHNENDDGITSDDLNGISVWSIYTETGNIENSLVTLYYKNITGETNDPDFRKNGYFDNSRFNIEYDLVWLTEPNNTIYVKTPKLDNDLESCLKIVLNSDDGSLLSEEKVFRY